MIGFEDFLIPLYKKNKNMITNDFQDRIEGEQTFSVIRSNTMTQVQVGDIVVGDIISVRA